MQNKTDNIFTTWDKNIVITGNLQYDLVMGKRDSSKNWLPEQQQNARVAVVDMPLPLQREDHQRAGQESDYIHGGSDKVMGY